MAAQSLRAELLTCAQIGRSCPEKRSPQAISRWIRQGVKARSGETVRLRHVRIGNKFFSTEAWLNDFLNELARKDVAGFDPSDEAVRYQTQADEQADRILAADGM